MSRLFRGITESEEGAVDMSECPKSGRTYDKCKCGYCLLCGNQKHTAVHGPLFGEPPGSKPFDHKFEPSKEKP